MKKGTVPIRRSLLTNLVVVVVLLGIGAAIGVAEQIRDLIGRHRSAPRR